MSTLGRNLKWLGVVLLVLSGLVTLGAMAKADNDRALRMNGGTPTPADNTLQNILAVTGLVSLVVGLSLKEDKKK